VPPFVEADGIRFAYPRFGKAGTGTRLLRRWRGEVHEVTVLGQDCVSRMHLWHSLGDRAGGHRHPLVRSNLLRPDERAFAMSPRPRRRRCATYTRKSSEEGLDQVFNSLDAQREACEAYIRSQRHEGWQLLATHYDDGGFSGGNLERPALQQLVAEIERGAIDTVVVYKVDRLTRALSDFARLVEIFDRQNVSFVSVTQAFNTTNSMGRLTLNVLLSFAQFECEVTGERIRDKFAASRAKGLWMGARACG
jgi:DNA invertase Pin-like site-specific DNA recombinase